MTGERDFFSSSSDNSSREGFGSDNETPEKKLDADNRKDMLRDLDVLFGDVSPLVTSDIDTADLPEYIVRAKRISSERGKITGSEKNENLRTEEQIFADYGLRPEDGAKTPEELELKNKVPTESTPLDHVGAIKGKELLVFSHPHDRALSKSLATEITKSEKHHGLRVFRHGGTLLLPDKRTVDVNGIKPGTYMIRERLAYLISKALQFHRVPTTILKACPEKNPGDDIASVQAWEENSIDLYQLGGWNFIAKAQDLEQRTQNGEELKEADLLFLGEYLALKEQLVGKALFDLLTLNSDVSTHAGNVLIDNTDIDNAEALSIDNALILWHPFLLMEKMDLPLSEEEIYERYEIPESIPLDWTSLVTKFMKDEPIPESILDNLREFREYIATGAAHEEWDGMMSKLENSFDVYAYMLGVVDVLLQEKKVMTLRDIISRLPKEALLLENN